MTTVLSLSDDGNSRWTYFTKEVLTALNTLPKDARDVTVIPGHELAVEPIFTVERPLLEMGSVVPDSEVTATKNGQVRKGTLRWVRALSSGSLAMIQTGASGGILVTNPDFLEFAQVSDDARLQIVAPPSGLQGATVSCLTRQVQTRVAHLIMLDNNNTASAITTTLTMETGQTMSVDVVDYTEQARAPQVRAKSSFYRFAPPASDAEVVGSGPSYDSPTGGSMSVNFRKNAGGIPFVLALGSSTAISRSNRMKSNARLISYGRLWLSATASIDPSTTQLGAVFSSGGLDGVLSGALRIVPEDYPSLSYETTIDAWSSTTNDFLPLQGTAPMRLTSQRKDGTAVQSERERTIAYSHMLAFHYTTPLRTKAVIELVSQQQIVSIATTSRNVVLSKERPAEIPERMYNPDAYFIVINPAPNSTSVTLDVTLKM